MNGEDYKGRLDIYFSVASGYVGIEAAIASRDYMANLEKVVSVDDILGGKFDGLKGYKLGEYTALVDKVIASGKLNKDLPLANIENVLRFFLKLPSEAGMKFYTDAAKQAGAMDLVLKMHTMTVDGVSIAEHVRTILGGSKKAKK